MLAVVLGGCTPPASRGGFDSDNPASKLYAIRNATHSDIPQLVEQLESDDPAVRMMTIAALDRLTGERMGYNPYASPLDRRESVDRWVTVGLPGPRGLDAQELSARLTTSAGGSVAARESVIEGLQMAESMARPEDRIVVFGSFQTVGPALEYFGLL